MQEAELIKYQDSVTFLSRTLDEQKLNELDMKILHEEKLKLQDILQANEMELNEL